MYENRVPLNKSKKRSNDFLGVINHQKLIILVYAWLVLAQGYVNDYTNILWEIQNWSLE